jgi:hypothetical protein
MSRLLQGTSRLLQVNTSLLLQRLLQFSLTLTCPHHLTMHVGFSRLHQHVFKASLLGFMASRILHLASWLQHSNNLKDSLLGFMTSRLLYLASWLHGFNTQTISLFHYHIIIITITSLSLLPHHHHHFHFDINDNIFSTQFMLYFLVKSRL